LNLEQVTLSNGEKTLVFQKMIHIGSESYYSAIQDEITEYKNKDFTLYFEGVQPGSQENHDKFDIALGIKFDESLYKNFSKVYGLIPQDNQRFLGLVNDNDVNVDTNIDYIIEKYEALKIERNTPKTPTTPPIDASKEIINTLSELQGRELLVLQFVNKAILSALTKNESLTDSIQENFGNVELFEIILEGRNQIVADKIISSGDTKIFATYGALHYNGVLELLKQNDPNWKIISQKDFYPIQ
ncbi:MAG: TraB/GumN family protein, partial [Candidatus Gracilibacteria bacterium]|nr:TraB/GumN family protein [Candidatus Gracilibacteria bacterium]